MPSKAYGALASGRPLCYVGPAGCSVARLIKDEGVGWAGGPEDAEDLADFVRLMANDELLWKETGERAREVFERAYDMRVLLPRWRAVLAEAANRDVEHSSNMGGT